MLTGSLPLPTRIGIARCCRDWPVNYSYPIRQCGICQQVPVVVSLEDEESCVTSASN